MGITPSQPVAPSPSELPPAIPEPLLEALWRQSEAAACSLTRAEFTALLLASAGKHNCGQPAGTTPSAEHLAAYLSNLHIADLALAHACAQGRESAWERFLALYQRPLTRAAIVITGSETPGRELADSLYAELYGLNLRDGQRRSPLASYQGRGSLLGWLRTTVAQRHVDRHRKTWREEQLPDFAAESPVNDPPAPTPEAAPNAEELALLAVAIQESLAQQSPEERFLLAAYYLDQRTLLQIARTLNVHEATISRKLRRAVEDLRKSLLRNLQQRGLSKRAAQEALGADPRDLTGRHTMAGINAVAEANDIAGMSDLDRHFKKLLQFSQSGTFPEKAGL